MGGMTGCDKETLRDAILALYADMLSSRAGSSKEVLQRIERQKERIFPKQFEAMFECKPSQVSIALGAMTSEVGLRKTGVKSSSIEIRQFTKPLFDELIE